LFILLFINTIQSIDNAGLQPAHFDVTFCVQLAVHLLLCIIVQMLDNTGQSAVHEVAHFDVILLRYFHVAVNFAVLT